MLMIRDSQMKAFQAIAEENYIDEMVRLLLSYCAPYCVVYSGEQLRARVADGIQKARSYGITWKSSIGRFVGLMFVVGPEFDTHPWIRRILRDTQQDPEERMDVLMRVTPIHVWLQARHNQREGV